MKHIHTLSKRQVTAAALIITVAGFAAIMPWQITAQESKSGISPENAAEAIGVWSGRKKDTQRTQ